MPDVWMEVSEVRNLATEIFRSFQSLESLVETFLEVSRVWKACLKLFWRFPESGKLAWEFFEGFRNPESL
jgi:hypothetical protein